MSEQQRLSPGTESPRTDWSDIGSICRTFGNEREAVTAIFSGRVTPGRNFWKDAADEIDRLRGVAQAPRTPLDLSAGELSTLATDAFREAAQASSWGAFKRPGAMVFLDGRNEHGSHVLPSLPTNMPPEYESDLPEYAEEIIAAAEALGFAVLDHVWAEWRYNEPEYGDEGRIAIPGYWEFVGINAEVTRALSAVTPSPVAGEWQPIEAAPRDGTPIEACNTRHPSHAPVIVRWKACGFSDVLPDPHWCDAATADGSALYFNENFFDFWKPTTALPVSSVPSTDGAPP